MDSAFKCWVEVGMVDVDLGQSVVQAALATVLSYFFDILFVKHVEAVSGSDGKQDAQVKKIVLLEFVD